MRVFEINCIIYDKMDPSNEIEDIVNINLHTVIEAEDEASAIDQINNLYRLKEIISILETL
jgi:hypothetical protein